MAGFRKLVLQFLPETCYEEFFVKLNSFHTPCIKIALSKFLGLGIIAGSLMVKFPQIIKIFNAKTAEGISFLGVFLEIVAITASVAYNYANNFPFSSWGEGFFLVLQTVTIAFLVLSYGYQVTQAWSFLLAYCAILYVLVSGWMPMTVLWLFQASTIPIIMSSKLVQAKANFQNKSTGQLSAITVFMLFLGSVARIFTSIQETGDLLIIFTYIVAALGNGIIAAQMVHYWNVGKPARVPSGNRKGKKKTN